VCAQQVRDRLQFESSGDPVSGFDVRCFDDDFQSTLFSSIFLIEIKSPSCIAEQDFDSIRP
jgi:hypothetical protein